MVSYGRQMVGDESPEKRWITVMLDRWYNERALIKLSGERASSGESPANNVGSLSKGSLGN